MSVGPRDRDGSEARRPALRRGLQQQLLLLAVAVFLMLVAVFLLLLDAAVLPGPGLQALMAAAVFLGGVAYWRLWAILMRHLRGLERLRGALVGRRGGGGALPPLALADAEDRELHRLKQMIDEKLEISRQDQARTDQQLRAVLGSLRQAVVVITDQGLISLANGAAKELLGQAHLRIGTSVFDVLHRPGLLAALDQAASAAAPIAAELSTLDGTKLAATVGGFQQYGGAIMTFAGSGAFTAAVDVDFGLHERPPKVAGVPRPDCRLDRLPLVVLDCETTGLQVSHDRILSVGAVRLQGRHIYHHVVLDHLVDPGRPIPPSSSAIHGITDAMVEGQPSFAEIFPEIRAFLDGCVLFGHNVPFDLAMLLHECGLAGIDWPPPPLLDLPRLAVALDAHLPGHDLESLAQWLDVEIRGRHTALGDSLVTAEIYQLLLPRLIDQGVTTLAEAQRFELRAQHIIQQQQAMGW